MCLPLFTQRGDALFDGFCFLPQALQILFEPGDLFLFGPEARPGAGMSTATAGAAVMMAPMSAAMMALVSTTHILTSLYY
jgi:hypothetical protein